MTKKRKAECTAEEWEEIRARARIADAKQRAKPERQAYMKAYMEGYMRTEEYRKKDNARYSEDRRQRQVNRFRLRTYGVDDKRIAELMLLQQGKCAVCKRLFSDIKERGGRFNAYCFDHCHDTGQHRGLLCRMCNTIEGFVRRLGLTPEEFGKMMQQYLVSPPAQEEVLW